MKPFDYIWTGARFTNRKRRVVEGDVVLDTDADFWLHSIWVADAMIAAVSEGGGGAIWKVDTAAGLGVRLVASSTRPDLIKDPEGMGCTACMLYPAAGEPPAPRARCTNCGRWVLDFGQFYTPDRVSPHIGQQHARKPAPICSCGDTLGDVDPRCPVHFPSRAL